MWGAPKMAKESCVCARSSVGAEMEEAHHQGRRQELLAGGGRWIPCGTVIGGPGPVSTIYILCFPPTRNWSIQHRARGLKMRPHVLRRTTVGQAFFAGAWAPGGPGPRQAAISRPTPPAPGAGCGLAPLTKASPASDPGSPALRRRDPWLRRRHTEHRSTAHSAALPASSRSSEITDCRFRIAIADRPRGTEYAERACSTVPLAPCPFRATAFPSRVGATITNHPSTVQPPFHALPWAT
ncbi:hypothetical protein BDY21DRAFT_212916 [Lineolata rhizophorae]|uniref:Uncharacterized protein n=1 Tax=Lineolata rhizophorae TaxID=578093 RepID=A0A6A6P3N4_9PEZI|nr:hypothetical protein BDY21DRAFT_212916 [Lineolata rhizophorae]